MREQVETGILFLFYRPLLTERQQRILAMWCEEDLSLSEIAERMQISRQGVSDCLHTAQNRLADYEGKLRLSEKYRKITGLIGEGLDILQEPMTSREIRVKEILEEILAEEEKD